MLLTNFRFSYFSDNRKLIPPSKILRKRVEAPAPFALKQWASKA